VRAKVICAEEIATEKKGWLRNGVTNNPKLFFFVEEVKMQYFINIPPTPYLSLRLIYLFYCQSLSLTHK